MRIRFFGQERDKTVIRLKDRCPGFDRDAKPAVSFGKADLNNAVAYAKGDGATDDSAAVQAALNCGKPVVYFPKAAYTLKSPVTIPATVERITAFYGSVNGQLLVSEDGSR